MKFKPIRSPNLPCGPINLNVEKESDGDTNEKLIRKFLRKAKKMRLMEEIRKHDYYLKPSMRKKLEKERGIRNQRKRDREQRGAEKEER
jgi:ribosomal protein S21